MGDRASDFVAKWGGSWYFIIGLFLILVLWMSINGIVDSITSIPISAWDPYPFIFLTFLLYFTSNIYFVDLRSKHFKLLLL
jgi:uncharacterized membrane protein